MDFTGDGINGNQDEYPEWVGESLYPLANIPGEAVAVDKVIDYAERNIGIIAYPGIT